MITVSASLVDLFILRLLPKREDKSIVSDFISQPRSGPVASQAQKQGHTKVSKDLVMKSDFIWAGLCWMAVKTWTHQLVIINSGGVK